MKKQIFAIIVALGTSVIINASQTYAQGVVASQQPILDRRAFEDSLHAAVAPKVMGYTFLLIKDGRVVGEGAGGLARNAADGQMKMTTRTPQNLGSLFKFIAGVTVLHMLDRARSDAVATGAPADIPDRNGSG